MTKKSCKVQAQRVFFSVQCLHEFPLNHMTSTSSLYV